MANTRWVYIWLITPGTLNNHFLMDRCLVKQPFLCNDYDSSHWNNHKKKLVVRSSRHKLRNETADMDQKLRVEGFDSVIAWFWDLQTSSFEMSWFLRSETWHEHSGERFHIDIQTPKLRMKCGHQSFAWDGRSFWTFFFGVPFGCIEIYFGVVL